MSYTKIPQKHFPPVCVVSLKQVAAGLFVLLVESSSVPRLLKLIYLQPIMFCLDSANLETRSRNEMKWNMNVVTTRYVHK